MCKKPTNYNKYTPIRTDLEIIITYIFIVYTNRAGKNEEIRETFALFYAYPFHNLYPFIKKHLKIHLYIQAVSVIKL